MSRSTISPLRRITATLALAGVAGIASVTVAPAALAEEAAVVESIETAAPETIAPETAAPETAAPETAAPETAAPAPATEVVPEQVPAPEAAPAPQTAPEAAPAPAPAAPGFVVSPLPEAAVEVKIGRFSITLQPRVVQVLQTFAANFYVSQGRDVTFNKKGELVVSPKYCDPTKSSWQNRNCVPMPTPGGGGGRF
jgi:hypothetical protein